MYAIPVAAPTDNDGRTRTGLGWAGITGNQGIHRRILAVRVAQLEPVVARAVKAKELPRGTSAELLYKHTAGPLYCRTLIMAHVLTEADADIAATAALAAARAGAFVPARKRR